MNVRKGIKHTILFTFFLSINILVILIISSLSNVVPPRFNSAILQEPYQEYRFTPLYSHQIIFNSELPFLYAQTSPGSFVYFFTWLREDWSLKNKSFEYLFLASKRISELTRFGNQLPVEGNYIDIDQFKKFQYDSQPRIWKLIFNHFNSWESSLARYMGFMDQEVEKIEQEKDIQAKVEKLSAFQNFVRSHKRTVHMTIYQLQKSDDEKRYLNFVANGVFGYYEEYITARLSSYDPLNIRYEIGEIAREKDFGVYNILIDSYSQPLPGQEGYALQYDSHNYQSDVGDTETTKSSYTYGQTLFRDITINNTAGNLTLKLPLIALKPTGQWKHHEGDEGQHIYSVDLPISRPNQRFFLDVAYQFTVPVTFQYAMVTTGKEYDDHHKLHAFIHEDKFANSLLPPSTKVEHFQQHIDLFNQQQDILTRVNIISQNPLPQNSLDGIQIKMTPVFEPVINFERTSYLPNKHPSIEYHKIQKNHYEINMINISRSQEEDIMRYLGLGWKVTDRSNTRVQVEFWPTKVLGELLSLFDLLILFLILQHTLIARLVHKSFVVIRRSFMRVKAFDRIRAKHILQQALALGNAYRLYILLASLFSIFIYIFLFKRDQSDLLPVLLLLWIIATAGYHIRSYIHFVFGLVFLLFAAITFIFQLDSLSEKAAIWTYLFFVVGTIQSIGEYFFNPLQLRSIPEFLAALSVDSRLLSKIIQQTIKVVIYPAAMKIKQYIWEIYGPYPETRAAHALLTLKVGITVVIVGALIAGFITIDRHNTRSSFNPTIMSIQPTIVYPSNKIIIKGKNFGWKQHEHVQLKYQGGEVETNFWTDAKIIFTVPLHWRPGEITIWIEKPTQWEGKIVRAKSEIKILKLLPRDSTFTPDDDMYFKQLKTLDKEVRKINGYD